MVELFNQIFFQIWQEEYERWALSVRCMWFIDGRVAHVVVALQGVKLDIPTDERGILYFEWKVFKLEDC